MRIWASRTETAGSGSHALRSGAALVALSIVMCAAGAGASQAAVPTCAQIGQFSAGNFHNSTAITNARFPLIPGNQLVLDGTVVDDNGVTQPHQVVFTVTDVTKVINGVRTVAVWDVDKQAGILLEEELSFFAQDDAGNVWNLGEYPEEFENGTFIGAPSVWVAGVKEAQAGIHMTPSPAVSTTFTLQGFAPDIEFEDCGRVNQLEQQTCVPAGCFDHVVITEEMDAFDPVPRQLKYYAPGVGIVRIGARNDPSNETLTLTRFSRLGPADLATARAEALRLDARGYQFSDVYNQTGRAEAPAAPAAAQPASTAPVVLPRRRSRLTARTARGIVRRALRARLRGWRVRRVSCRLTRTGAARCTFTATRRGQTLRGNGTVRRLASGRARYRLRVRIARNGCRPVTSRRCSRTTTFSR
jgi:hypothetical protein